MQVRSRAEFTVDTAVSADTEKVVAGLLQSPSFATGLPFKLTTYAFQDPDSTKIRLLVAAEVDRADAQGRMALGLALIKPDGETGATFYQPAIEAPTDGAGGPQTCFATLLVEPGSYRLKAAVVDSAGHRGSLERPVRAYMTRMSRFRATQLLIGDGQDKTGGGTIVPTVSGDIAGKELYAYMELFADSPAGFTDAAVKLEILPEGGTAVLQSAPGVLQPAGSDPRVRAAAGSVVVSLLPAGDYVARASVSVNGQQVGEMTRPFRIVKK